MAQLFGGKEEFFYCTRFYLYCRVGYTWRFSGYYRTDRSVCSCNEPSHHIAYLYDYVGQPWKTQEITRRLLHEMYAPTPEGIIGNEDCGQMSGWYILSSLGIYSVCPGSNEFALTTPLFEKAVVNLANGKTLTILANNPKKNVYITKVELNGQPIDVNFITYAQLMEGGDFVLLCLTSRIWREVFPLKHPLIPILKMKSFPFPMWIRI